VWPEGASAWTALYRFAGQPSRAARRPDRDDRQPVAIRV